MEISTRIKLYLEIATIIVAVLGLSLGIFNTYQANFNRTHHLRATVSDAKTCQDTEKGSGSDFLKKIGCIQSWNHGNRNASISAELESESGSTSIPVLFRGFQSLDLLPNQKHTLRLEVMRGAQILNKNCYILKLTNKSLGSVYQKQYVFLNEEGEISPGRTVDYNIKEESIEANNICTKA